MECNKDEAKRAMDIAERKLAEKDYDGAKKFATKAQNLYPDLDGVKHMLLIIEVYIAGERRIGGEPDWYGILGAEPYADEEEVKRQYRERALTIHPDKNKSKGAEGAFELIRDAWKLLSNQTEKSSYNARRQIVERPPQRRTAPVPPQQPPQPAAGARMQPPIQRKTFWTKCNICKTQYEFLRCYLNQTLLCPTCSIGFPATETPPPPNYSKPDIIASGQQQHPSSKSQPTKKNSYGNGAKDTLKRGSQERDAAKGFTNSDLLNFKRPRNDTPPPQTSAPFGSIFSNLTSPTWLNTPPPSFANGNAFATPSYARPQVPGLLSPSDIAKAAMNKAQLEIFRRLPQMIADMAQKDKANKVAEQQTNGQVEEEVTKCDVVTIVVPDSDFHDFDLDRSEGSFQDDQIWAAYDDDDGMPRFYARIQKVVSLSPFKMRISWLGSKTCSEFGPMDWIGSGFAKTCGDFRTGRYELTDTLNAFSHRVDFAKGARGLLHILPKKGQVWALYRNWSPEWDKDTPDEVIHKYDMVEVLDGYTEEKGSVAVALLVKAEGFKAIFRRSTEEKDVREIVKEEMFRFSHQVPHYVLTGKEAENAQEGWLELDPAATPGELLSEPKEEISSEMENGGSEAAKEKSSALDEGVGMKLD